MMDASIVEVLSTWPKIAGLRVAAKQVSACGTTKKVAAKGSGMGEKNSANLDNNNSEDELQAAFMAIQTNPTSIPVFQGIHGLQTLGVQFILRTNRLIPILPFQPLDLIHDLGLCLVFGSYKQNCELAAAIFSKQNVIIITLS
jgi:hypothetical protein